MSLFKSYAAQLGGAHPDIFYHEEHAKDAKVKKNPSCSSW